ncbi:hypothetical protein [Arsenophonus sp. ENCA]|uniref:hypothetical protein n=1 Tax=Arsenophonus sp. ENCA TaxID=1987579 RepID=UPI0025C60B0F|nr:hypothetical protein [Arsenophonus sp. ENCA]
MKKKERSNMAKLASSMIPHVIGNAVVALIDNQRPITLENIIQHFKVELHRSPNALLESWYREALTYLQDSVSPQ